MRAGIFSKEYPPEIYGGAGVHVAELTRFMREIIDVSVHCMGSERDEKDVFVHGVDPSLKEANAALQTLSTGLRMANAASDIDVAHSHTWYTGLGGHLASRLYGIPHVVTAHSLEPHRPWKREQLGGGYEISSWSEKNAMEYADAVIAVSAGMKDSILDAYPRIDADKVHVVLNGIDTQVWQPGESAVLDKLGVDKQRPIAAFVGRITRQKGVKHLLKAAQNFDQDIQLVLCAGAPDTPEIAAETEALVEELRAQRDGVFWVKDMLSREEIKQVYSGADVFVCPSIYEPLGIVNLEAMACGTAVVASNVGGIPEVVVDGETGVLVNYDADDDATFEADIAAAVNRVAADKELAQRFGAAGRQRAIEDFSWATIAQQTVDIYRSLM
ncbi:glycogen synthase [Corynebacterium aurimucosum]|uniref:Glycogen synthase n=2 Tax=Corynebacterium TaxID=1716 RepID=A0ABT0T6Z2_9CORY|nr:MULTISPECIES: glycogen synthase [Corynebacterium]MCL8492741.1 glycogen synthase [Corynebacterium intestinale]MCP1388973.1 glycogen synthase [Corynebacterium intestinale]MCZ9298464.1 glycogen synthase [Corynebacterium hesseae]MTE09479.1 glycogen synthase [Corynebacterium guaraldiae]OFK62368.1 glycosyl transferase family 1 [Corynebacterium sp. HMSC078A10]